MIPTYNRLERLKRALKSALDQSYPSIEILIADNASEDGTDAYLKSVRSDTAKDEKIKIYRHEKNIGLIANWNFLIQKASGDYCLMLSDDDELYSQAIEHLIAALADAHQSAVNGKVNIAIGNSSISDKAENNLGGTRILSHSELIEGVLGNTMQVLPSATIFKLDLVKSRGYREYYSTAIDLGLLFEVSKDSQTLVTNELICQYNIHADNVTAKFNIDDIYKTYRRLLRTAYGSNTDMPPRVGRKNFLRKILSYVIAERYARKRISMFGALTYMRKYSRYFGLSDLCAIALKMITKRICCRINKS